MRAIGMADQNASSCCCTFDIILQVWGVTLYIKFDVMAQQLGVDSHTS